MLGRLLLLFTIVPMIELYLLLWVSRNIGFGPTLAIVLVTGLLGAILAKAEGMRVVRQWQASLHEGRMPEEGVLGGVLVLVGGVLLVTPGVITDAMGLLLLFPPTRRVLATIVRKRLERSIAKGSVKVMTFTTMGDPFASPRGRHDDSRGVIEVEGEVIEGDRSGSSLSPEERPRLPARNPRSS